jgi:hypothetical protein
MKGLVTVLLVLFLAAQTHQAGAQTRDNWFWPSVEVQKKFFGDLTLSANAEARINNDYSNLRGYFGEFEAKWDFNKWLAARQIFPTTRKDNGCRSSSTAN